MSSIVESSESSALKICIATYCLYILYFSESGRLMSSEVEVKLTICPDLDCWSLEMNSVLRLQVARINRLEFAPHILLNNDGKFI